MQKKNKSEKIINILEWVIIFLCGWYLRPIFRVLVAFMAGISINILCKTYLSNKMRENSNYVWLVFVLIMELLFLFLIFYFERKYHNNIVNGIVLIVFIITNIILKLRT